MKKVLFALVFYLTGTSAAGEPLPANAHLIQETDPFKLEIRKTRLLGVNYHQLDDHTRLLGWQLHSDWYFGRSRAESSEVALIWKKNSHDQVSFSKDGIRFLRRF